MNKLKNFGGHHGLLNTDEGMLPKSEPSQSVRQGTKNKRLKFKKELIFPFILTLSIKLRKRVGRTYLQWTFPLIYLRILYN